VQDEPRTAVSYKEKTDRQKDRKIAVVDKKHDPEIPIKRPKPIQETKLKKGRRIIQKYIRKEQYYLMLNKITN
jgi:hypothetical protein